MKFWNRRTGAAALTEQAVRAELEIESRTQPDEDWQRPLEPSLTAYVNTDGEAWLISTWGEDYSEYHEYDGQRGPNLVLRDENDAQALRDFLGTILANWRGEHNYYDETRLSEWTAPMWSDESESF